MGLLYKIVFRYLSETLGNNKYIYKILGKRKKKAEFQRRGHAEVKIQIYGRLGDT